MCQNIHTLEILGYLRRIPGKFREKYSNFPGISWPGNSRCQPYIQITFLQILFAYQNNSSGIYKEIIKKLSFLSKKIKFLLKVKQVDQKHKELFCLCIRWTNSNNIFQTPRNDRKTLKIVHYRLLQMSNVHIRHLK